MFNLYNTFSKNKEIFFFKKNILIYLCGITVYDSCHIGHARIFLFFDSFIRYLKYLGFDITFVRNITDIDDKILDKSKKIKKSFKFVTNSYIKKMHLDISNLNLIEPTFEPKATVFINNIIDLISFFKKKGYAYNSSNGDLYFSVKKLFNYGRLSNRFIQNSLHNLKSNNDKKLEKEDFVLWKNDIFFKKWKAFLGYGRPGWHTECAAMSFYYSKNFIDIHSGGIDLLFPHHENEMAQTRLLINDNLVKFWMHIGQLKIQKKKMSKSLNNFIFINDFLKNYNEEYLRFFYLLSHYRKSVNFSIDELKKTNKALDNLYEILLFLEEGQFVVDIFFKNKFLDFMKDDINTCRAISILFEILKKVKKSNDFKSFYNQNLIYTIKFLGNIIGLFKYDPLFFLKKKSIIPKNILSLLRKRNIARLNKNWQLADAIRHKIHKSGFMLKDNYDCTLIEFIY